MTTAQVLSTVSLVLSTLLGLLRALEALNQGSGPLAVNASSAPPAGSAPSSPPAS